MNFLLKKQNICNNISTNKKVQKGLYSIHPELKLFLGILLFKDLV